MGFLTIKQRMQLTYVVLCV